MINQRFEKEAFKKEVEENVKQLLPKNCRRGNTAAALSGSFLCR